MEPSSWRAWLKGLNLAAIDQQIDALKNRITGDQHEIVCLLVIRKGIQRSADLRAIGEKKAQQAIDEAIAEANGELPSAAPAAVRFTAEGGIKQTG